MALIPAWIAVIACAAPGLADERVALVVGNAHYKNAAALATPNNDASDLAGALTGLGFKVELRLGAAALTAART